jgi:hypothetical protein
MILFTKELMIGIKNQVRGMEEKKLLLSISISDGSNYTSVTLNIH